MEPPSGLNSREITHNQSWPCQALVDQNFPTSCSAKMRKIGSTCPLAPHLNICKIVWMQSSPSILDSPAPVPSNPYEACSKLAREHYENFPVGRLVPKKLRPHVHAVYAFARVADDLADEGYADPRAHSKGQALRKPNVLPFSVTTAKPGKMLSTARSTTDPMRGSLSRSKNQSRTGSSRLSFPRSP